LGVSAVKPATQRSKALERVRGMIMLIAGSFSLYKGLQIRTGQHALVAYGLAALALGIGVFHLTRKAPRPRV
jgi:hypothetical protein